jgi:predicted nucleotidyltransferase
MAAESNRAFQDALERLSEALHRQGLHHFLIGGQAMERLFRAARMDAPRTTEDIDMAVRSPTLDAFRTALQELEKEGFTASELPYRWIKMPEGMAFDLIPYGPWTRKEEADLGNVVLSVKGMRLVGERAFQVLEWNGAQVPVVTVEGLLILKWIAWQERPEHRIKDLQDSAHLLVRYWDLHETLIYATYTDVFADDPFDTRTAGVRVCGRRLGNILADEPDLRRNMVEFLAAQAGSALSPSPLQRALMTVLPGGTPSAGVLLRELLRGIGESAGDRDR